MAINNGYATLAQVKAALRITDSVDDTLLEMATESASRAIDLYCNRNFYSTGTAVSRDYVATNSYLCEIDDLVSLTSLQTVDANDSTITWTASDYQLEPLNNVVDGSYTPTTRIRAIGQYVFDSGARLRTYGSSVFPSNSTQATVTVTGVFGWESVPTEITQATVIQASRIYKRLDSPLGIISGELGSMRIGSRLDPDVAQLVDAHRKIRMA